jgi:dienelactone hydrolase
MTRRDVSIPTPDGSCDASLHTPDGAGPWPAVIMFPDAGGVRPTFHGMAQQLADLDRVGAAASFHGGRIATDAPDSPHLLAGSMTARVYVAGAENDASFDDDQRERLSTALTEAGVDHTLVIYPAAHGFAVPDNPTYDEAAAARHWEALAELYSSVLATP